jgi:hypothetical protein
MNYLSKINKSNKLIYFKIHLSQYMLVMKIVVFDLDETLGYFTQYGIFWDSLANYLKSKNKNQLTQSDFDDILDLYPEFLRPNIINILIYLKNKKRSNCCHKMMIYTNNTGPREWAKYIVKYFEKKINFKIIDQIIAAFKINGKRLEICRTTQNKTHKDLIKCTKIPADSEICFMDDFFYPEMVNDNIYYINIKPYMYELTFEIMIKRFLDSDIGKKLVGEDRSEFEELMIKHIKLFKYMVVEKNEKEYEVDKVLGKHIITHLEQFFNHSTKNRTIKNRGNKKNRTFKKRD